jgi:hypothetical protein
MGPGTISFSVGLVWKNSCLPFLLFLAYLEVLSYAAYAPIKEQTRPVYERGEKREMQVVQQKQSESHSFNRQKFLTSIFSQIVVPHGTKKKREVFSFV